jgi:hypothetical protein
VARKDLWRKEFDQMLLLKSQYGEKLPADYSKRKVCLNYYQKIVPTLYFDFFRYFGDLKFLVFKLSDYLSLFIDKQKK